MSARFAELMALSASQTRQADIASQQILAEKKRKEEIRKKEQMERDRKDREMQMQMVRKRMEDQQREKERQKRSEEERRAKEQVLQKREEEQRKSLLYGPKGGRSGGGGQGGSRPRKVREGSDDGMDSGAMALTREEKRQRKLNADLNRNFVSKKSSSSGYNKSGKLLKGGAVNATITAPTNLAGTSNDGLSIKARIAAMPNCLVQLNTVKRDTRTIDEIVRDRAKAREAKTLAGDEAREFHDWFGKSKKQEALSPTKKATSTQSSLSPSPPSRAITPNLPPMPRTRSPVPVPKTSVSSANRAAVPSGPPPEPKEPRTKVTIVKPEPKGSIDFTKITTTPVPVRGNGSSSKLPASAPPPRPSSSFGRSSSSSHGKRARSYSESSDDESPPPPKRRTGVSSKSNSISSEIWKLFGKDRDRYMQEDVYSDEDDDMEADADALRREELRSARIAKKEDEVAFMEERRHEEEKRKKKKEKDRKGY